MRALNFCNRKVACFSQQSLYVWPRREVGSAVCVGQLIFAHKIYQIYAAKIGCWTLTTHFSGAAGERFYFRRSNPFVQRTLWRRRRRRRPYNNFSFTASETSFIYSLYAKRNSTRVGRRKSGAVQLPTPPRCIDPGAIYFPFSKKVNSIWEFPPVYTWCTRPRAAEIFLRRLLRKSCLACKYSAAENLLSSLALIICVCMSYCKISPIRSQFWTWAL